MLSRTLFTRKLGLTCLFQTTIASYISTTSILRATPKKSLVKNESIPGPTITFINPEGQVLSGSLLSEVLKSFNRKEYDLIQVSKDKDETPVCKILSKKELFEKKKKNKSTKSPGSVLKELEITTVISDHDLGIKMRKAMEFLTKGYRLQFTILRRSGLPFEPVLDKVRAQLEEIGKEVAFSQKSANKLILSYIGKKTE